MGKIKVIIGFGDPENIENEYHDGFFGSNILSLFFRALKTFFFVVVSKFSFNLPKRD